MAVYEYRCTGCGEQFEVWTQFEEELKCPSCGATDVGRLMSATNFKLNGPGFYVNDYGGKKPPPTEAAESSCGEAGSKPECAACPAADSNAS